MEKKLSDNLNNKYKNIFPKNGIDLECGNGWYYLIDELLYQINGRVKMVDFKGKVTRICEHWGEVVISHTYTSEPIISKVQFAENLSLRICEKCGTMQNVKQTKGAWISTICGSCFDKLIDIQKDGLIF